MKKLSTGDLAKNYMKSSNYLLDLASAIGRIVISYKGIQNLAGYTS